MHHRRTFVPGEHQLPILAGFLALLSLVYFPLSRGSILADLPEIAIPLGVSFGLAIYSVWVLEREPDVEGIRRKATYGWAGALVTSFGVWTFIQQLRGVLSVTLLFDEALTVVSIATGIGVFVGSRVVHECRSDIRTDRTRLLAETVWTNYPGPNSILVAITTQLAEIEGVDPLDVEPLYEQIDPDIFAELQDQDDSQWQLLVYTEEYEIRVSGLGTVTIYDIGEPAKGNDISVSSE